MKTLATRIETFIGIVGRISSWSLAFLLLAISSQVILRYVFGQTFTLLEDSLWYLFAFTLVLGLSYTMIDDGHVRVDFLYQRYSPRLRRWVDLVGIVFFLMPLYAFLAWHGWEYAAKSFAINESSPNPEGMPWLWLVKFMLPFSCILLLFEALAKTILLYLNRPQSADTSSHGS